MQPQYVDIHQFTVLMIVDRVGRKIRERGLVICGPSKAKQPIGNKTSILFYTNPAASGPLVFLSLSKDVINVVRGAEKVSAHDFLQLVVQLEARLGCARSSAIPRRRGACCGGSGCSTPCELTTPLADFIVLIGSMLDVDTIPKAF